MTDELFSKDLIKRLEAFQTIYVAFSGGLDSTVLLHALFQTISTHNLIAIHVNHGLSAKASIWQAHCEAFCHQLNIPIKSQNLFLDKEANIEEAARQARYQVFSSYIKKEDCLLLAHHADDQAETILFRLMRGAGIEGLAGMRPERSFAQGVMMRPFLSYTRAQLEAYAIKNQLIWVNDESNLDTKFSRNYLRQAVMPMLRQRWPKMAGHIHRTVKHCQNAQLNLQDLAILDCPELNNNPSSLALDNLLTLPDRRLKNILRYWLEKNEIRMLSTQQLDGLVREVVYAKKDAQPKFTCDNKVVIRSNNRLYLMKSDTMPRAHLLWPHFPNPLLIDTLGYLQVTPCTFGLTIPKACRLEIRFRVGGEQIRWRGQTKQLKKLLQMWRVPTWKRDKIPLLYIDNELASVIGYAISDRFFSDSEAYQLTLVESID